MGITAALQRGSSPVWHLLEGKAPLWHCDQEFWSGLHLTKNMRIHSYSGHPSVSEETSDDDRRTDRGMSPHDQFHLFTGEISV